MPIGYLYRRPARSGFKVVCVIGFTPSKVRVCVWSEHKRKWSKPQTTWDSDLENIYMDKLTPGQRATVMHALNNIATNRNHVGGVNVGPPMVPDGVL